MHRPHVRCVPSLGLEAILLIGVKSWRGEGRTGATTHRNGARQRRTETAHGNDARELGSWEGRTSQLSWLSRLRRHAIVGTHACAGQAAGNQRAHLAAVAHDLEEKIVLAVNRLAHERVKVAALAECGGARLFCVRLTASAISSGSSRRSAAAARRAKMRRMADVYVKSDLCLSSMLIWYRMPMHTAEYLRVPHRCVMQNVAARGKAAQRGAARRRAHGHRCSGGGPTEVCIPFWLRRPQPDDASGVRKQCRTASRSQERPFNNKRGLPAATKM